MDIKNEDYISKFKQFLYDKSLEYYLYIERIENPPFKDIIDFCGGDFSRLVDYDSNGEDIDIRKRNKFVKDIGLFVDMALESGELKGKSRDILIGSYINPLEAYRSMLVFSKEYGVSIENIEQGVILKQQLEIFYNDLYKKYLNAKQQLKTEYELLELKSLGEEAQKINLLLDEDGNLLEPLEDYEMLFAFVQESGLDPKEQEQLLSKILLSSLEVFQILEPEKEIDIMDYLTDDQIDVVNYVKKVYELNRNDFELISNSDEVKTYIQLYRDLKGRDQEINDNYFGNYAKDYIYRLMCLTDIDSYLKDFVSSVKRGVNDPSVDEYKELCFSELVEAVSSFNEIELEQDMIEPIETETLDVDLFDVVYLFDKNGDAYIEEELTGTYSNKEYYKKISSMVLKLRNSQDVGNPVVNSNRWPIFIINKGELALSYMNLGNNVKAVITVGDVAGNDDIYSKTTSIVNKNPEYINNLISCANDASKKEQLVSDNQQLSQRVSDLLSGVNVKRKRG